MTRRPSIQHKQLEPPSGTDINTRRRLDRTRRRARARKRREDSPLPHAIAMRAARRAHEAELRITHIARREIDRDRDLLIIRPIRIRDGQVRLRRAVEEIRRQEDLDAVFFRVHAVLRVRAGDDDAPVLQEGGLGVVEARDDRGGHDAHAAAHGLAGVVQHGAEVGGRGEPEAGDALVRAVYD